MESSALDRWARGWRGPWLAALVALIAGLPGLFALPPLDRDESRFAQASAQMLETHDFVSINFQDQPREKKPVAIHWLQAASVALFSSVEDRQIWAYRIPSLLGAMLAAAACAWGAAAFWGPRNGLVAGAILGVGFLLSTEADIAKTDAVLCGTTTLALAALGRLYGAANGGAPAGRLTKILFWLGIAVATLDKGPVGPMVAILCGLALWAWDRKAPWARDLGWTWGLVLVAAIVGPWAIAITVQTDGGFWTGAVGGDLAPKLAGGHESHGAPPGLHTLASPLLLFPMTALLPAALVLGWKARAEPGVRFALCWLIPTWLVFEALPTKLVHYPLPTYGALAWLMAAAFTRPMNRWSRWGGAALSLLAGALIAAFLGVGAAKYGATGWAIVAGALCVGAGIAGAIGVLGRGAGPALLAAGALGVSAHAAIAAGMVPRLRPLLLSTRTNDALRDAGINPRDGLVPGPVAVVGYAEPSLVFLLGTETELGDPDDAAEAISEGRPVVIEKRRDADFRALLAKAQLKAHRVATVSGLNYSKGEADTLILYRSDMPPPDEAAEPPSQ